MKGLEHIPEGGARCFACYALRLRHAAALAKQLSCEYFCTTLSVSPHKNAAKLNELGCAIAEEYSVKWLPSDFKKADGFRRSTALSAEYGMYRQDYCGCVFSKREAEARRAARAPALYNSMDVPAGSVHYFLSRPAAFMPAAHKNIRKNGVLPLVGACAVFFIK